MKTKTFSLASRLALLALALTMSLSFTSCGSDDKDDDPSVENRLSEETTPITFSLHIDDNFLFDYAYGKYIGSDTLYAGRWYEEKNIELRQGSHHLVWLKGIDEDSDDMYGVHFNPATKRLENNDERGEAAEDVRFVEKDIEVTPYLMPVQKLEYENYATCMLVIRITDSSPDVPKPVVSEDSYVPTVIGRVTGIPFIQSVSLTGTEYTVKGDMDTEIIAVPAKNENWDIKEGELPWLSVTAVGEANLYAQGVKDMRAGNRLLCPLSGLVDVRPKAIVYDVNGNVIPTTELPRITLLRGCVTCLTGPLFSGSTSDWSVSLSSYSDFGGDFWIL